MFGDSSRPIEYRSRYGTTFKGRADLTGPVCVLVEFGTNIDKLMSDCVEFGSWHQRAIHPTLNGFGGYDTIDFRIM